MNPLEIAFSESKMVGFESIHQQTLFNALSWSFYEILDGYSQKLIAQSLLETIKKVSGPRGTETYRRRIRSPIRGLWSGQLDFNGFVRGLSSAIERGLERAWINGAAECGIRRNELTQQEFNAMGQFINTELEFVEELGTYIVENPDLQLTSLYSRVESWVNRYNDAYNQGMARACQDQKLEWLLGPTKNPCKTCRRLAGKVKRASYWIERGIYPQRPPNEVLACGGWKCLCRFWVTTKPLSRGPLM